ncbi:MAG: Alternative oxidase, ubiquinol oxidase, partial [uncultured Acidimicrobiales bacterium]
DRRPTGGPGGRGPRQPGHRGSATLRPDGAPRPRRPRRPAGGEPADPASEGVAERPSAVLDDGRALRRRAHAREVPGARAGRPGAVPGMGERGLRRRHPHRPPDRLRPPGLRPGAHGAVRAGQRAVAPAHPRGAHRRPGPAVAAHADHPAGAGLRLLPALVVHVRRPPGMELPPERRLRGPCRARVRTACAGEPGLGARALRGPVHCGLRGLRQPGRPLPTDRLRRAPPQGGERAAHRTSPIRL